MFEFDPAKKAEARLAKYEAQKQKRIEAEEKPKDPRKTFSKVVGLMAALGAASNEDVRATGKAIWDGVAKGVGGRELLVDLPRQPIQVDMPPALVDGDAQVAQLENKEAPQSTGGGR